MAERLLHLEDGGLPEITAGEVIRSTPNFRVVTGYKPGLEGKREGERFFLEPTTLRAPGMLMQAAMAHNIYNFNFKPVYGIIEPRTDIIPCLRADYIPENVDILLMGAVKIPKSGEDTIPSPDRMDTLIQRGDRYFTFSDELPKEFGITNPMTRHLKVMQAMFKDDIPSQIIHSNNPDSHHKVRKGWWAMILPALELGLENGEFNKPQHIPEIESFIDKYTSEDFIGSKNPTTAENISEANALINKLWQYYGSPQP